MKCELKIMCICHQVKITMCGQIPLIVSIAQKIVQGRRFLVLNPNLLSNMLSSNSMLLMRV